MLVVIVQFILLLALLYSQHFLISEVLVYQGYLEMNGSFRTLSKPLAIKMKRMFFLELLHSRKQNEALMKYCVIGNAVFLTLGPLYAIIISTLLLFFGLDSIYAMFGLGIPYALIMIYDMALFLGLVINNDD